jgi:transposase
VSRPSKFAPEFKARAIDLYRSSEGRTIADVARELGIGTETFRKWVRQDEADRGERDDRLTSKETEELKRLRKENAELKRTNEILRLASAFSPRRPTRPGAGRDVCGNASSHLRGCAAARRDRRTGVHLL